MQEVCSSRTFHTSNERYIFSQLMKCPYCGATMTGFTKHNKCKDGTITHYKRYRCSRKFNRHPEGICITESVIENYMLRYVALELDRKIYQIKSGTDREKKIDRTPKIRAQMDRLNNIYMKGRISEQAYDKQYAELENMLDEELKSHTETVEDYSHIINAFSGNWLDIYKALDAEHKNAFWKKVSKEIVLSRETHKVDHIIFLSYRRSK